MRREQALLGDRGRNLTQFAHGSTLDRLYYRVPCTRGMASTPRASKDQGDWDVAIVGGGPAGATTAAFLARAGRRVLLLEKEHFPRYHVGESLIPGCLRILDALGVRDEVERAGFVVKRGGTFTWGVDGEWSFSFAEQNAEPNYAYQVERSRFDQILLNHARDAGAEVREGVAVRSIDVADGDPLIVSDAGTVRARYVVDASGQNSILGSRLGGRYFDESLRNVAIWRYFRGCKRLPEPRQGDIMITRHGDGWWWLIPLESEDGGLTSLGLVLSAESYKKLGSDAESIYEHLRAETPELQRWMEHAHSVSEIHRTSDWSYRSRRVAGDRWLIAGDAAGFIDPLLSTGCYLALTAGYLAGLCLGSVLDEPELRPAAFRYYGASYDRVVDELHAMVRVFYRTVRARDAFDGAQAILGESGDPRQLFIRLAAGLVEQSVARGDCGYFEDSGLGSEVFGAQREVPERYGASFAIDRERVLGPVDPADLPAGVAGDMVLVERDMRLRLVPASEAAAWDAALSAPPTLASACNDEAAEVLLRWRVPATASPVSVVVFKDESPAVPVAVCFTTASATERYWTRVGDVAIFYIEDVDANPFERAESRELLEAIARFAESFGCSETCTPETLLGALVTQFQHPDWRIIARATLPPHTAADPDVAVL